MGIVKSVRAVGRRAGRVIDEEDRTLLAKGAVLIGGGGGIVVAGAAVVGLAIRVFGLAAG